MTRVAWTGLALVLALAGSAGAAESPQFKNFTAGSSATKPGLWQSTTTVLEGPEKGKVFTNERCVDKEQIAKTMSTVMEEAAKNGKCTTEAVLDTSSEAVSNSRCKFGPAEVQVKAHVKRVNPETLEVDTESKIAGQSSRSHTVMKYKGVCSVEKAAQTKSEDSAQCQKCKERMDRLKTQCAAQKDAAATHCQAMVPQMETVCKLSCHE